MKKRVKKCKWCGSILGNNEYAAFCPENPNAENNRKLWKEGKAKYVKKGRKIRIGPAVLL